MCPGVVVDTQRANTAVEDNAIQVLLAENNAGVR